MDIEHGKDKIKMNEACECPCCFEVIVNNKSVFFPRQIWHPHRTYDFFRGYKCDYCGYLITKDEFSNKHLWRVVQH